MDRGAWQATVYGVTRVGQDLATLLLLLDKILHRHENFSTIKNETIKNESEESMIFDI